MGIYDENKKKKKNLDAASPALAWHPHLAECVVFCYYRCSITNLVDTLSLEWVSILCAVSLDMVFLLDPACGTANTDHNTSKYVALPNL